MKVSAIICAAGRGERAAMGKNKLLADLDGAPALWHTLNAFCLPCIDEVIVACSPADMPQISALCAPFGYIIAEGGWTRTESVYNALEPAYKAAVRACARCPSPTRSLSPRAEG